MRSSFQIICRGLVFFRGRPARIELQSLVILKWSQWWGMDEFSWYLEEGLCKFMRDCSCEMKMAKLVSIYSQMMAYGQHSGKVYSTVSSPAFDSQQILCGFLHGFPLGVLNNSHSLKTCMSDESEMWNCVFARQLTGDLSRVICPGISGIGSSTPNNPSY